MTLNHMKITKIHTNSWNSLWKFHCKMNPYKSTEKREDFLFELRIFLFCFSHIVFLWKSIMNVHPTGKCISKILWECSNGEWMPGRHIILTWSEWKRPLWWRIFHNATHRFSWSVIHSSRKYGKWSKTSANRDIF